MNTEVEYIFLVISHIEDFNCKDILNNCLNIHKTKSNFEPLVLPTFEQTVNTLNNCESIYMLARYTINNNI